MHGTKTKGAKKTKAEARGFILYKTYLFRDKDPKIDQLRTIVQDAGLSYREIEDRSGVKAQTLNNWFHKETKRPRFCSLQAVGRACGKSLEWVDYDPKKHGK